MYEDEGTVPFLANSPFLSFYRQPAGEYPTAYATGRKQRENRA
jgi:uncharacterized membrane protein YkgB